MIEAEDRDTAVQSFIEPSELIRVTAFERFKSEPCTRTVLSTWRAVADRLVCRSEPVWTPLRTQCTKQSKKYQEKRLNMAHGNTRLEMFQRQPATARPIKTLAQTVTPFSFCFASFND
ncbi:hypothetical protein [Paraburkholderia acidicola]|uniref:hypothetical protein n=1 Tax=Paraburkholderia acidicola TaxID=1912599 RepID=UPI00105444AA|nr:hypothetical protein [Paraburkholderia acidicola]